jgi:hypothetical protein
MVFSDRSLAAEAEQEGGQELKKIEAPELPFGPLRFLTPDPLSAGLCFTESLSENREPTALAAGPAGVFA